MSGLWKDRTPNAAEGKTPKGLNKAQQRAAAANAQRQEEIANSVRKYHAGKRLSKKDLANIKLAGELADDGPGSAEFTSGIQELRGLLKGESWSSKKNRS